MSWFTRLFGFGRRRPPPPPPAPLFHAVGVSVLDDHDSPVRGAAVTLGAAFAGPTNHDGYIAWAFVPVPGTPGAPTRVTVVADGYVDYAEPVTLAPTNQIIRIGIKTYEPPNVNLPPMRRKAPTYQRRAGVVHGAGPQFVDDGGAFLPLGATLFWALRGWKFERERITRNLTWLASHGFDYYRVFGEVAWAGLETDPRWPDYRAQLAGLIDFAYDVLGLRTQLTMFASATLGPTSRAAAMMTEVVQARPHKVIFVEVANEWYANFKDEALLKAIGHGVRTALPQNLVALSAPREENAQQVFRAWNAAGASNMGVAHFDRRDNTGEWKWRHVRKPWEPRQHACPASSNEPGGPRSSGAAFEEPIHLVMSRAVGILCGYDGYVLHNGAGIFGVPRPDHGGRPANLWEIPGIDRTATIVRALDGLLPPNPSAGTQTRAGLGNHPLTADAFVESSGRGVVRDYAITNGNSFWQTIIGLKDHVGMKARAAYALDIVDPIDGSIMRRSVKAGETFGLYPRSHDSRGFGALIIRGART